MISCT